MTKQEIRDDRFATRRPHFIDCEPGLFPAGNFVADVKEDGQWVRVDVEGRTATVWNRHGIQLEVIALDVDMGGHSVLYGEMLKGTTRSKADPRQGKIVVFDCEEMDGVDISGGRLDTRRSAATTTMWKMDRDDRFECVRMWTNPSHAWETAKAEDLEGIVIKDPSAPFGDPWYRMKRVHDLDYVCTGYVRNGAGEATALRGGVYRGAHIVDACKVPIHGTARRKVTVDPESFVGRVFKARGNDVTAKGALRAPRFVEWHADKEAGDCIG